ncbi:hypothetical protein [Nocardioides sp. ChNu-99]|uniref:antitoxin VbhA family protein n=1 Tax=Nocardioides sp. ChNu-99 TaxID=2839897 RepID=UPI0024067C2C|nr:hypothetical protein [Nocardioides sp. ChNu-99]MDF9716488.1 hypothetical protein [Nocardioides sp. ChNu-99]
MGETLDIEERWPEFFEPLTASQRNGVRQAFAASWHEGRVIEREDVELLTAYAGGAIDYEEYLRRGTARAEQLGEGPHP